MWQGDYPFLMYNLVGKDFKVRYRNMSLGVLWSVINPLVMMAVLWFVFTQLMPSNIPNFPVFLFCGLVPFNFFAIGWLSGSVSVTDNVGLIKRLPAPREVFPISAVLAQVPHLLIQLGILFTMVFLSGYEMNVYWLLLPVIFACEVAFVCGLALAFSALNVLIRDTRYVIESMNVVLWWLVPIVYPFETIPQQFKDIYQYNPIAALVLALRTIIMDAAAPSDTLMIKLVLVSGATFLAGWLVFKKFESRFYSYL